MLSWTAVGVMSDSPRESGMGREAGGMLVENCCIERMRRPKDIGSQIEGTTYQEVRVNTYMGSMSGYGDGKEGTGKTSRYSGPNSLAD